MRCIILFVLSLVTLLANARLITPDEAKAVAADFFHKCNSTQYANNRDLRIAKRKTLQSESQMQPYYVFNAANNGGFVIVSGDDRTKMIIGYSDTGTYDFTNVPPQLAALLEQHTKIIDKLPDSQKQDVSWYSNNSSNVDNAVLLETVNWGQGFPYNTKCPIIDGEHSLTGCVATAMAIVMKYHNWPMQARGWDLALDHSMEHPSIINFEDFKFDYSLMPSVLTDDSSLSEIEAVSNLMFAAGMSVRSLYGQSETGAFMTTVAHELCEKFRYSPKCEIIYDKNSQGSLKDQIVAQLDAGLPVILAGTSSEDIGHAFVCDGYDQDSMVHINWGWDGMSNGFYDLDFLQYGLNQCAVVNIKPDETETVYSRMFTTLDDTHIATNNHNFFNISVVNINENEPFDVSLPTLNSQSGVGFEIGLALIDRNSNIKCVSPNSHLSFYGGLGYGNREDYTSAIDLALLNQVFNCKIDESDRIAIVTKDQHDISGTWKLVLGCTALPTILPVIGNVPRFSTIEFAYDPEFNVVVNIGDGSGYYPEIADEKLSDKSMQVLVGKSVLIKTSILPEYDGYGQIFIEGETAFGVDHLIQSSVSNNNVQNNAIGIFDSGHKYSAIFNEYVGPLTINLDDNGTLKDKIDEESTLSVKDLTLTGRMDMDDFYFIATNLRGLQKLDLEGVTIVPKEYPKSPKYPSGWSRANYIEGNGLWPIDYSTGTNFSLNILSHLVLPANLKGIGFCALGGMAIKEIKIPSSVTEVAGSAFSGSTQLEKMLCYNPIPPVKPIEYEGHIFNTCGMLYPWGKLYVPDESVKLYKSAPGWSDCANILPLSEYEEEPNILVTSIFISPETIIDKVGAEIRLSTRVEPENATNKNLTFLSSDDDIASVSSTGVVKLRSIGTAKITAWANDGSRVSSECQVIVEDSSDIDSSVIGENDKVKIYNMTGCLVYNGKFSDAKLSMGLFIVVTPTKVCKINVK